MTPVLYRTVGDDGHDTLCREAGDRSKPALLLPHSSPTASHMTRELIPLLADDFHLVAPDLSDFRLSVLPSRQQFTYSFDDLAEVVSSSTELIGLDRYAICDFDRVTATGRELR